MADFHPTLGFFSPAGAIRDVAAVTRATAYFQARGCQVKRMQSVVRQHQRFAGTELERLQDIYAVLADPEVEIALATRGGYGLSRLLPQLDFDRIANALQQFPKALVGHSDCNLLQFGLFARTGIGSWCGPMACFDFAAEMPNDFMQAQFWQALEHRQIDFTFQATDSIPDGQYAGTLWGGNLSLICALLGTPWLPQVKNGILFVEEVNEHPYRIERMLLQLLHAGILPQQQLILLGDCSGYRLAEWDAGYDLAAALGYLRSVSSVPIIAGLPFGHVPHKACLPIGGAAQVQVANGFVQLTAALS